MRLSHPITTHARMTLAALVLGLGAGCTPPTQGGGATLTLPSQGEDAGTDAATGDTPPPNSETCIGVACSDGGTTNDDATGDAAVTDSAAADVTGGGLDGAALYASRCAPCHGPAAAGTSAGPALDHWHLPLAQLTTRIAGSMPPNDPTQCDQACAEAIAAWLEAKILPACAPRRRGLRLLSRREWERTVQMVLPGLGPAACQTDVDCAVQNESCVAGACVADPCGLSTFVLPDPEKKHGKVHVAGAFNGWAKTVAAGGAAMSWQPKLGAWLAKVTLQPGTWPYKFVADEQNWITDPANPDKIDDGYGGLNSVLTVACTGAANTGAQALIGKLAAGFPAEVRPSGYAFDQHAEATLVQSVHVEQQLVAAAALAKLSGAAVAQNDGCGPGTAWPACADAMVQSFGRRAFRRPLLTAEVDNYRKRITSQPDATAGAQRLVRLMLCSPHFLYRFELGSSDGLGGFTLDPWERASLLAYTLTGGPPDALLLQAAETGALSTAAGMGKEAERLLTLPHARSLLGAFALMWLGADAIAEVPKSAALYPGFDAALRAAAEAEVRRFYAYLLLDGSADVTELFTANWTFADAALAAHYGIAAGSGPTLQKVAQSPQRSGVLGMAAPLATTAHSDQSSPIRRGLFVRNQLLCHELPPPPPDAGGVPEVDPNATTKERFAQHTADPFCKGCHHAIDPVGFGFEHFDAVGGWRTLDAGKPVDAAGDMVDVAAVGAGTSAPFASLSELGAILAKSPVARDCHATWWWRFAAGGKERSEDRCAVQALHTAFAQSGGDLRKLLVLLVQQPGFVQRGPGITEAAP